MRSTFGVSPIPNQAMNRRAGRERDGPEHLEGRVQQFLAEGEQADGHAQDEPGARPIARPTVARTSETPMSLSRFWCKSRSQKVRHTVGVRPG